MCDLMLLSTHDNKVIFHVCNVRIVHVWKTKVTVFQYKNPLSKRSERYIGNTHLSAMTRVNLTFCHKKLTVVWNGGLTALVIAFDMALA